MDSHPPQHDQVPATTSDVIGSRVAVGFLVGLVYELLDANEDIVRLAIESGLEDDPVWEGELDYLRRLQRVAREGMALATEVAGTP
jgi:hypothetical protein